MTNPIGPLVAADEGLCHQIPDTFAVVGTSDLSWTEKICAMAAAKDGRIQLGFGLGKYTNRNVMDGYGGVSVGVEQRTVRASRRLASDPESCAVGPLRYEVLEPLRAIRFVLEPNAAQPVSFEWTFEAIVPPSVEDRTHMRHGYRVSSDLVRYHQIGVASGWVEVDGTRTELAPDAWVSTRDHSWGVRYEVGLPPTDLEPRDPFAGLSFRMIWSPIAMERPDGSRYGLFLHYQMVTAPGFVHKHVVMGGVEHPDGRVERFVDIEPDLRFDTANRRLLGGRLGATTADGVTRTLTMEAVSDTGFHLGAGLYFGFDGHHHGEWRGELSVDGEHIADCTEPVTARRLHQLRDTVVHVTDVTGGGEGWGNCQPIITGGDPALGLSADDSFI
ncbi:MAG TPA: hypothetical protein VKU86_10775 [Acidimicrobiales bacterium]|nr:hypothetical protein [Acidimicrobiales bacterium]